MLNGYAATEVPSTGIVGSEELTKAYARIAKDHGANIVTNAAVERLEPTREGIRVVSSAGEIETRCLVNSAGLFADEIAAMLGSPMAAHKIYPGSRRILRTRSLQTALNLRTGLSAAASRRGEPWRSLYKDRLGKCFARPNGHIS